VSGSGGAAPGGMWARQPTASAHCSRCPACRRWQDEHSDQAEQLGQRIKELQQQQDSVAQLTQQLKQEQQQLAAAQARCVGRGARGSAATVQ
jgi:predicted anti-sigma-YlaC factor YlaD